MAVSGEPCDAQLGLVISRFGQQADILDSSTGETLRCHLRPKVGNLVTGDKVCFEHSDSGKSIVTQRLERDNALVRPTPHQGVKAVVANLDLIAVVISPLPTFSEVMLDRYLIACRFSRIPALIVANKMDLLDAEQAGQFSARLEIYREIGYQVVLTSTEQPETIINLLEKLSGQTVLLAGQSGVGKSSLLNRLSPEVEAATGEISESSGLGKHTTTASRLYLLDDNTVLVDSPGVREFGLWHLEPEQLAAGFREFEDYAQQCRFRNCTHLHEPGCAVIAAAKSGEIAPARLASYRHILENLEPQK